MYRIEGTTVYLTRGDTFESLVTMKYKDGTSYVPQNGDVIRFAMKTPKMTTGKKEYIDKTPLIQKVIPNDSLILTLEPSDTKNLSFGNYKYDIEITFSNGKVCTFIDDADFVLTPEVH